MAVPAIRRTSLNITTTNSSAIATRPTRAKFSFVRMLNGRPLIDSATCQTFTEVIITDKSAPYVIGTRLRVNHDKIAEIESQLVENVVAGDGSVKSSAGTYTA